jgi:MoCo/4Fe-4S cofactor protein with predicted Tat translocation signal
MEILENTTPINQELRSKEEALVAMRSALDGKKGRHYWRTLDEVTQSEEFKTWFEDEFPNRKELFDINRRDLLKFAGAGLALAGLTGCRSVFLPEDKVVPYVKAPEELVPGKPLFYASAMTLAGYATGVIVEQHEGRPIKLEGNAAHSASLGAIDPITQAQVLSFYDPDRSGVVMDKEDVSTWELFSKAIGSVLSAQFVKKGAGIRMLVGTVTSPTHARLLDKFKAKFPEAVIHSYEPAGRSAIHEAVRSLTGKPGVPVYDFSKAKVVVSLDGDFLSKTDNPGALKYARQFAKGRRVVGNNGEMNRLYSVEAAPGLVGAMADHRYPSKPSEVVFAAYALANALGIQAPQTTPTAKFAGDLSAIVADLKANGGASIVIAGEHQPSEIHRVAFEINSLLGNVGKTVNFVESPEASASYASLGQLAGALANGSVEVLIIDDVNVIHNAPSDLKFEEKLAKAKLKVHIGAYHDETGLLCDWHLPATHELESWGDARAFDGTASIIQPLIAPLFDGRTSIQVLSSLIGDPKSDYELVRETWKSKGFGGADFEGAWRTAVHEGVVPNTASKVLGSGSQTPINLAVPPVTAGLEAIFVPDPAIFDGRYANNGWLQELPRPLTKVVWDNVVTMAAKDAEALEIKDNDIVTVKTADGEIEGIAFVLPGQPVGSVVLNLGYGRTAGGTLATIGLSNKGEHGGGFNTYKLRTTQNMTFAPIVSITKTGGDQHLASTQGHSPLGGNRIPDHRDVIRSASLVEFNAATDKLSVLKQGHSMSSEEIKEANLFPEEVFEWDGDQWGMTIDMNTCIGCNACVTACQAENNISVVGKEQVSKSREMHWIRIDRYYSGSDEDPDVVWQPVACVHCEKAPCEPVCPVAATVHSHEGLNQMVYNRCVGTRYCSNNCPYKVRRFNYLNWSDNQAQFEKQKQPWRTRLIPGPVNEPKENGIELLRMLNNPDVTVRGRGVMEKCTYCVQRINDARIESKKAGRKIADGDIVTACESACPTEAIIFGNIGDKDSRVAKMRKDPRSYLLLEELQTRPRTSHLAKLRNPNPNIKVAVMEEAH